MNPVQPSLTPPPTIRCEQLGARIVVSVIGGRPTREDSQHALVSFRRIVAAMDRPVWVSDATKLEGYEPASLTEGRNWFDAFKARGGKHLIVVSSWSVAMMAARAMGLGFGVHISDHPSFDGAVKLAQDIVTRG